MRFACLKHSKFSTMKFSNVSVLAATSLLINLTNETVSHGKVLALIRAQRNADFPMLPIVSEMLKILFSKNLLKKNHFYSFNLCQIVCVNFKNGINFSFRIYSSKDMK